MESVGAKNELTYAQFSEIMDKLDAEADANFAFEDDEGSTKPLPASPVTAAPSAAIKSIDTSHKNVISRAEEVAPGGDSDDFVMPELSEAEVNTMIKKV